MLLTEDNYTCKLPKDTQEIAQKELNETNKLRKKAISDVRKWIKSQTHIRRIRLDSSFILRFLRMQKFDIKESCEILEKYLTMRGQYPSWFQNLDCRVSWTFYIYYYFKPKYNIYIHNYVTLRLSGHGIVRPGGQGIHFCVA